MSYGARLKAAREHAKLTQYQLAEAAGIKQPTVSYLENPKNNCRRSEYTMQLARACNVNPYWLADNEGEMLQWPKKATSNIGLQTGEPPPERVRELLDLVYALPDESLREVIGLARYLRNRDMARATANHAA